MYKKLSILILTSLTVSALEAKRFHKESSKTQTKLPTKLATAKKAPINDDFSWITDPTKGIPGFSLGQEENLKAGLEALSPQELSALQEFLNQKTPQAVQAALSSTNAIPGVNNPDLVQELDDLNTEEIQILQTHLNTPVAATTTTTDNDNDDIPLNLDWLFDPAMPIPGATKPTPEPSTPTLTTAEQIIAAYATLPAAQQEQVTQSLLSNENNVGSILSALSSSRQPILPTSSNAAAQQYLLNLQSAFGTLQTLIDDMLASSALKNIPIRTYLQNSLLELCASVSTDSTNSAG